MKEEGEIRKTGPYSYEVRTPKLEAAEQKAKRFVDILNTDEFILAIDGLIEEIKTWALASRFPVDKPARRNFLGVPTGEKSRGILHPELKGASQAERKRKSLIFQLEQVKNRIKDLAGEAYDAAMNFEASKIE